MTPTEIMEARLTELRAEYDSLFQTRGALIDKAAGEKRGLTDVEQTTYDEAGTKRGAVETQITQAQERLADIVEQAKRSAAADANRVEAGLGGTEIRTPATTVDPPIYAEGKVETSFFRDLYHATKKGDHEAGDRLRRNDKQRDAGLQKRALGNTGAVGGSGGEFAPPLWLIDEFVKLARPGRKFADSLNPKNLPSGVASINLPRVLTGTTTAIQTTQNTALSQTDMTTGAVSSGISTIGGKQVVSLQLLQQSGIPFDEVILQDLAADYARQFSSQAIFGTAAAGQLNGVYTYFNASGTVNITWTQATPAVGGAGGLYSKIFAAAAAIETARFLPPDTIWMHPRRWNWILASSDTQNRPLVNPMSTAMNVVASNDLTFVEQGVVGMIGSLAVITDASIQTTLGAGVNQDPIYVGVRGDLRLWESPLRADTFEQTYADSAGVLFRVLAYTAAIPGRYASSVSIINGTGSVAPLF